MSVRFTDCILPLDLLCSILGFLFSPSLCYWQDSVDNVVRIEFERELLRQSSDIYSFIPSPFIHVRWSIEGWREEVTAAGLHKWSLILYCNKNKEDRGGRDVLKRVKMY
jgi:hypothetical protein